MYPGYKDSHGQRVQGTAEHSAECFGDTRDHWWNRDFLRLMAKRWKLDAVRDVLDVGCGVGHWGVLLASVMPGDVRVTGVDREPSWVEQARARAAARGLDGRFSYQQGEARAPPLPRRLVRSHDLPDGADPPARSGRRDRRDAAGHQAGRAGRRRGAEQPDRGAAPRFHLEPGERRRDRGAGALPADLRARQGRARRRRQLARRSRARAVRRAGAGGGRGPRQRPGDRGLPAVRRARAATRSSRRRATAWRGASGSGARPTRDATFLPAAAPRATSPPTSRARSPRASGSSAAWTTPPTTGSSAARSTSCPDERAAVGGKAFLRPGRLVGPLCLRGGSFCRPYRRWRCSTWASFREKRTRARRPVAVRSPSISRWRPCASPGRARWRRSTICTR